MSNHARSWTMLIKQTSCQTSSVSLIPPVPVFITILMVLVKMWIVKLLISRSRHREARTASNQLSIKLKQRLRVMDMLRSWISVKIVTRALRNLWLGKFWILWPTPRPERGRRICGDTWGQDWPSAWSAWRTWAALPASPSTCSTPSTSTSAGRLRPTVGRGRGRSGGSRSQPNTFVTYVIAAPTRASITTVSRQSCYISLKSIRRLSITTFLTSSPIMILSFVRFADRLFHWTGAVQRNLEEGRSYHIISTTMERSFSTASAYSRWPTVTP